MTETLSFKHSNERNLRRLSDANIVISALKSVWGTPQTLIDLGGGQGAWCAGFLNEGSSKAICIDHPDSLRGELLIPRESFTECDFTAEFPEPETADLALCIEVAEHLPSEKSRMLIDFLTSCSDTVLFSAAIPGQQGQHHVNCQPPSYWRDIFAEFGYERYDCLRPMLFNSEAAYWLKQNLFLYSKHPLEFSDVSFPVCHDDSWEIVSKEVLIHYRSALELRRMPLRERLKNAILRRLSFQIHRT